jgi:hypothetical protein
MSTQESRIPEKRREYQGEEKAEAFVNWLNSNAEQAAKNRIMNVVRLFLTLYLNRFGEGMSRGGDGFWQSQKESETKKRGVSESELQKTRSELERELQEALDYYRMTPSISLVVDEKRSNSVVLVGWRAAPGSKMRRNQKPIDLNADVSEEELLPGVEMGEAGAIKNALELIESGYIFKIFPCRCRRFYFQKFSHQRFCSTKCRIAASRDSDEARRKRNEYARKLYHLHKSGKVR